MDAAEKRTYDRDRKRLSRAGEASASVTASQKAGAVPLVTHAQRVGFMQLIGDTTKKGRDGFKKIQEANERQAGIGRMMQDMAMDILEDPEYKIALMTRAKLDPDLLRRFFETGVKIERMAIANPADSVDENGVKFELTKALMGNPGYIKEIHHLSMRAMGTIEFEEVIDVGAELAS